MRRKAIGTLLALGGLITIGRLTLGKQEAPPGILRAEAQVREIPLEQEPENITRHAIAPKSTAYMTLRSAGLTPKTIQDITHSLKSHVRLNRLKKGSEFVITWSPQNPGEPKKIVFVRSLTETFTLTPDQAGQWQCEKTPVPVTTKLETFAGTVNMNLWESAKEARMESSLVTSLAEVFAWQVDFSREVKPGDRWRLTVERKMIGDQTIGWGPILAAEYENDGRVHTAIRYQAEGEPASYYAPDGSSLKQLFLKSPIRLGRITSYFSVGRFHPILKVSRPHNGVDYGAAPGTPIMAVGGGTVVEIGYNADQGNTIKVKHNGIYETSYLHMQKFAEGLRKGSVIDQGQIIGYVGATGLATGPHLHFSFFERGRYVDPLGVKFPAGEPIAPTHLNTFRQLVANLLRQLPDWKLADHRNTAQSVRPSI